MNKQLIVFLLVVLAVVAALVFYDRNRNNPWSSDVFFSSARLILGV